METHSNRSIVGRLAPSPTGAQHVGNARTYLLAWLSARSQGGRVILRIEDIDSPRVKPWAVQQAMDDLRWLGLDWDAGPDDALNEVRDICAGREAASVGSYVQTERLSFYRAALDELKRRELVYPCTCTRSDIEAAASAPHVGQEGPVYPGTCRHRQAADAVPLAGQPFAWRFRYQEWSLFPFVPKEYVDLVAGKQRCLPEELGDFVVCKVDGTPAYQLAVVVDDHAMGITEVIRGDDLIASTFRQLALYASLGWTPPQFGHVPLVIGPDGRRLAKRHGDTRLSTLHEAGVPAECLVGYLAWTCGLQSHRNAVRPNDLVGQFAWERLPRSPLTLTERDWQTLLSMSP